MRFISVLAAVVLATPAFAQSNGSDSTASTGSKAVFQSGSGGTIQIQMGGMTMGGSGVGFSMGGGNAGGGADGAALNTAVSLGMNLAATRTKRDTLGIFIESVAPHGPAEQAGIVEGDRLVAIDTVDLRLAGLAVGDAALRDGVVSHLKHTMEQMKAGTAVRLRIYAGGQTKTVMVTPAAWSTVYPKDASAQGHDPVASM